MYATWGVPAHSVVVADDELVPLAGLLAAGRSVLGLLLVLVLMPVLDLARELGPEPEPAPAPGCDVAACRTFVVLVPALPPLHRLSDFELEFVPPVCKVAYWRPYWVVHKLVDLSFVEGMRDGVAGFGVGAEAALAEAGQWVARTDVENCWAPYCQRLLSRAKRAKAQHGETKLRH